MRWSSLIIILLLFSTAFGIEPLSEDHECSSISHEKYSFDYEGTTYYCTEHDGVWAFDPEPISPDDGYCYFDSKSITQELLFQEPDCCDTEINFITDEGVCCEELTVGGSGACSCPVEWQYFSKNSFPGISYDSQWVCCDGDVSYVKVNSNINEPQLICQEGTLYECSDLNNGKLIIQDLKADFSDNGDLNDFAGNNYYCVYKGTPSLLGSLVNKWFFSTDPIADARTNAFHSTPTGIGFDTDGFCYLGTNHETDLDCCSNDGFLYNKYAGCCDEVSDIWFTSGDEYYGKFEPYDYSNNLGFYCNQGIPELPDETETACESQGGKFITLKDLKVPSNAKIIFKGGSWMGHLSQSKTPFCCLPADNFNVYDISIINNPEFLGACERGIFRFDCNSDADCESIMSSLPFTKESIDGESWVCDPQGGMFNLECSLGSCNKKTECKPGHCGDECCLNPDDFSQCSSLSSYCDDGECCTGSYGRDLITKWGCESSAGDYKCEPKETQKKIGYCGVECLKNSDCGLNHNVGPWFGSRGKYYGYCPPNYFNQKGSASFIYSSSCTGGSRTYYLIPASTYSYCSSSTFKCYKEVYSLAKDYSSNGCTAGFAIGSYCYTDGDFNKVRSDCPTSDCVTHTSETASYQKYVPSCDCNCQCKTCWAGTSCFWCGKKNCDTCYGTSNCNCKTGWVKIPGLESCANYCWLDRECPDGYTCEFDSVFSLKSVCKKITYKTTSNCPCPSGQSCEVVSSSKTCCKTDPKPCPIKGYIAVKGNMWSMPCSLKNGECV